MKKAFVTAAIFTMTGILLAGYSAVPSANMTEPIALPVAAVVDEAEETAPDVEDIILSDSNSDSISDIPVSGEAEDTGEAAPAVIPVSVEKTEAEPQQEKKPQTETKAAAGKAPEAAPTAKAEEAAKPTAKPVANAGLEIIIPSAEPEQSEPVKTEPTPQPEKPAEKPAEPTPAPTVEPTPAPTPEPTPEPQPEMEVMGGGFNSDVLAAINEARALHGNAGLSLDSGLCAKAVEHAKEMARQGKRFHSCGGVESVSDSSSSGRTIGARSAIHASDLELNAGLTSLGVGSVKIGGKQYTCVIGR